MKKLLSTAKAAPASVFSIETEPVYLTTLRDIYSENLTDIVTDDPGIFQQIYFLSERNKSGGRKPKPVFIRTSFFRYISFPAWKTALDEVQKEKVWLNSGGFIVIQQTEAFVSIDVNSGKVYRKEKGRGNLSQNQSGSSTGDCTDSCGFAIFPGSFLLILSIWTNPDHNDELFHVLQKYLRKDPVKCKAVDITPLHILEMTRKKVQKTGDREIRQIKSGDEHAL